MPKKKQQQRRAKGVTIASSTAAIKTLRNEGLANQGFIGFSAFANSSDHDNDNKAAMNQYVSSPTLHKKTKKTSTKIVKISSPQPSSSSSTTLAPFYQGENNNLKMIFKGISKKDPTTKLKSAQELMNLLPTCIRPDLARALPHFAYLSTCYIFL